MNPCIRRRCRIGVLPSKLGLSLAFVLWLGSAAFAQRNYTEAIQQGDEALRLGDYKSAVNKYFAAEAFDKSKRESVRAKVNGVFEEIDRLRKEAEKAKAQADEALEQLAIATGQTVGIVLSDIDRHIYRLEYELTYPKCRTALNLKARRREVEKRIWEIAWFYTETDSAAAALAFLGLLGPPLGVDASSADAQAQLRAYLAQSIPAGYWDTLQARYYPQTVLIEGGDFLREDGARVRVDSFRMGRTEVTYWQYHLFARAEKHPIEPPVWGYAGDHPALYVSWFDAALYLNWLSERQGKQKVYKLSSPSKGYYGTWYDVEIIPEAKGYRLPTEAEWVFAARGGNKRKGEYAYSGSDAVDEVAWHKGNAGNRTHPVGQKKANDLGLYDMSGNVWEWCGDYWQNDYDAEKADNPTGPDEGALRVVRGGSWYGLPAFCRVSFRDWSGPDLRFDYFGFRLSVVP